MSVCLAISLRWHISTFCLLCVSVTLTFVNTDFHIVLEVWFLCNLPKIHAIFTRTLRLPYVHVLYVVQRLSYSQATAGMSQPQLSAHYHGLPRRPSIPADQTPVPHPTACREQQFNPPFQPHSTPCQADLWWVTGQAWERIKRLKDLDFDHLTWKGGLWELDFTIHCITYLNKSMLVLSVFTDFWWCNAKVWISLEKHC